MAEDLIEKIERKLEIPMLVLSFVWLVLMIAEFTVGLTPFWETLNTLIWVMFVVDALMQFSLAPSKKEFLRRNWVLVVSLVLPALRILRIFRAARILRMSGSVRALRLARVLTSMNRGISALGRSLSRRGFGYVVALTVLVLLGGAAGIFAFEREGGYIDDYPTAIWWTAMTLTTMGADYFPKSTEGRLLCLMLAIYGFAVFGYVTAVVATYFVGREADEKAKGADLERQIRELREEIRMLTVRLTRE